MTTTGLRNGSTAPPNVFRNIQLQMGELKIFGRVFVLGTLNGGGGEVSAADHFFIRLTKQYAKIWALCSSAWAALRHRGLKHY